MEPDDLRVDSLDDDGVTKLQELLEMSVGGLTRQSIEWTCLHHRD